MPALNGKVIITLRDDTGADLFVVTITFTPGTGVLLDATIVTSAGNRTGAMVIDNVTGGPRRVALVDASNVEIKSWSIPGPGRVFTANQLDVQEGITTVQGLNGLRPDLT